MRATTIALAAAGLIAGAAAKPPLVAAPPDISAAFQNTIVSTYPDGRQAELWLNADGTYTAEGRAHDRSKGHWKIRGEKLCLSQSSPFVFGFTFCTPLHGGGVGTSWRGKAVTGEPIQITVVKGRA
ncbi:MAG TPA: hypothetical protein VMU93_15375 [Caulobacteraceae bacterium]|nr:hypothetical protein [Caulobacteraceae bacterium]